MKYDVVVIGAGPAGATAAKVLAEKHASVLLIDKQEFPRDKPCGGGIPVRGLKRFPYLEHLVDSFSYGLRVYSSSLMNQARVEHREPVIAMVRRSVLDAGLVDLAVERGVLLRTGVAAERVTSSEKGAVVTLADGSTVAASSVVVADGQGSHLARCLGHPCDREHIGVSLVEEYPVARHVMDEFFSEGRQAHVFMNILGIAGYGWVFPKDEHVNIGLGEFYHALPRGQSRKNLKGLYAVFLSVLKKQKIIPESLQAVHPKGGVFPTMPLRQLYGDGAVVCGDAAGLTNPLTGEGIFYGMVSGELAAGVVLSALDDGRVDAAGLSAYQREWMRGYGEDYRKFYWVSKRWRAPAEMFIRIIEKDQRLKELAVKIMTEDVKVRGFVWTLGPRLTAGYMKARLGLI